MHFECECINVLSRSHSRVVAYVCVCFSYFFLSPNVFSCSSSAIAFVVAAVAAAASGKPAMATCHPTKNQAECYGIQFAPANPCRLHVPLFLWMNRDLAMCVCDAPAHAHTHILAPAARGPATMCGFFHEWNFRIRCTFLYTNTLAKCLFYEWLSGSNKRKEQHRLMAYISAKGQTHEWHYLAHLHVSYGREVGRESATGDGGSEYKTCGCFSWFTFPVLPFLSPCFS